MRSGMVAVLFGASLLVAGAAQAGCLTGAAIGGVAGHVAGHHGLLGAAAGCAIGHHEANIHNQKQQAAQTNTPNTGPTH